MASKTKKKVAKGKKVEKRKKSNARKIKVEAKPAEEPQKKVDIDTTMYRDLFKFLDDKVSVECFIDLHDRCFGKQDCECHCHIGK